MTLREALLPRVAVFPWDDVIHFVDVEVVLTHVASGGRGQFIAERRSPSERHSA